MRRRERSQDGEKSDDHSACLDICRDGPAHHGPFLDVNPESAVDEARIDFGHIEDSSGLYL